MCTLIALHRAVPGAPLVVAANRDEYYDRPAEGPGLRRLTRGLAVMPLDVRAGGTWLGVNAEGLFAAVTNLAGAPPDPNRRSRGWLVQEALLARDADEAADRIESDIEEQGAEGQAYNPFNLLVADRRCAWAIGYAGSPRRTALEPGVHVIGNAALGEPTAKLLRLGRDAGRAAEVTRGAVLDALARVCRGHEGGDALQDACVHTERYGTRSSTLLRLGDGATGLAGAELRYADGAPCRVDYEDFTPLLHELGRGSRFVEGEPSVRNAS